MCQIALSKVDKTADRLCYMAIVIVLITSLHAFADVQQFSLFSRLATALQTAPAEQRDRFAAIALDRLAEAYMAEAQLVYQSQTKINPDQRQWARSVEGYANELFHLKEMVEQGQPATIDAQLREAPMIVVGQYRVMLSHPRPDQQLAFEHEIVEQYCQSDGCEAILGANNAAQASESPAADTGPVQPRWEFTAAGPACADQGIRIAFEYGTDFNRIRAFCNGLFHELQSILDALDWQRKHQVVVDWSRLRIGPATGQSQHVLLLNGSGDTAVLSLPLLYKNPQLFSFVTPWLQARLDNGHFALRLKAVAKSGNETGANFTVRKVD